MPRLNSNSIPPNTSQGRTFAANAANRPGGLHPAPTPRTETRAGVVVALALVALVMGSGLLSSLRYTATHAVVSQSSPSRHAEPEPIQPSARTTDRIVTQPQMQRESSPPEAIAPEMPTPERTLPTIFHPPAPSDFRTNPAIPEIRQPAIIMEPERDIAAFGLRLVSMRSHRHHLQLPNGHVIRTFDVGRLCDDMISGKARAAGVPAARPGNSQPRLDVEIVRCETFQARGTNLFTAKVTLHARWLDAAGRERNQCFVNGHCNELVAYDQAIGRAAKGAVDGVVNLLSSSPSDAINRVP